MDLQLIFQWHQLLHFIAPIVIMILFHEKLGIRNTCKLIIFLGLGKEVRDKILYDDPLWLSGIDIIFDSIGIAISAALGITLKKYGDASVPEVSGVQINS